MLAKRIVEIAENGERDSEKLCEAILSEHGINRADDKPEAVARFSLVPRRATPTALKRPRAGIKQDERHQQRDDDRRPQAQAVRQEKKLRPAALALAPKGFASFAVQSLGVSLG